MIRTNKMNVVTNTQLACSLMIISMVTSIITAQTYRKTYKATEQENEDDREKISWCTISNEEQQKCNNFAMAVERDKIHVGYDYFKLECKQAFSKDECMVMLDNEKITMTTLDAGEVFVGGRYHSLIPIAQEISESGKNYHYAVAVVKVNTLNDVRSLKNLRGKRGCFAGVGTMSGWIIPINMLMKEGGLDIIDCNNHVKSATEFFGPSCAVNSLTDKYNPIGDNSDKLCQICIGKVPGGKCTDADPYAGFEGAFRCLLEAGEIAFLKHTTVEEQTSSIEFQGLSKDGFELFCKDGTRRPIHDYQSCNWGMVPNNAIVTTSASSYELRKKYQRFLKTVAEMYSHITNRNNNRDSGLENTHYDVSDRNEFDTYGRPIRYKRQSINDFNLKNDNNQFDDSRKNHYLDQYRNEENNRNPYNEDDTFNRDQHNRDNNQDPYNRDSNRDNNRDPYNRDNNRDPHNRDSNRDNNGNNNRDPFNRDSNRDPFIKDPYVINRDQYGINIDPYSTDLNYNKDHEVHHRHRINTSTEFNPYHRPNVTYYEMFNLFESSPRYGIHANLIFQDVTKSIAALSEAKQTFSGFLAESLDLIMGIRSCPVDHMTLCVTSDSELEKCIKMRTALKAQLLKPEMRCEKGHSQINCMQKIQAGASDVAIFDASDVYTAGLNFELIPFISEIYNLGKPEYYVVAVAKEEDPSTELTYLREKSTCHGGINTAAGWVYPLAYLISNGWIRPYGCNSIRAAAEYFTKSCVPGALSTEYNTGVPYDNLCDLCHGASFRYCRRDASEDYYGHTGAFRCLVEGGGHVAFVKHTTVMENTGGQRREWWARDNLMDDFELLCPDGTRAEVQDYRKCNLGKVKANAIITRGGYRYNETEINAYINLFLYSQTFYGRKTADEFSFSMFSSNPPFTDLIFQDATQQLKIIEPEERYYSKYLGRDYMRARRIVDCHAGSIAIRFSNLHLFVSAFITLCLSYVSR